MELERTMPQWSLGEPRIKWAALFAGWVVGLATQMMLTLLGLGIGAWSIDFRQRLCRNCSKSSPRSIVTRPSMSWSASLG
jgi:hypothetical protein